MNRHLVLKFNQLLQISENKEHKDKFAIQNFFDQNKSLGSKDRKKIKALFFKYLKYKELYSYIIKNLTSEKTLLPTEILDVLNLELLMFFNFKRYKIIFFPEITKINIDIEQTKRSCEELEIYIEKNYDEQKLNLLLDDLFEKSTQKDLESIRILFSVPGFIINSLLNSKQYQISEILAFFNAFNNEADLVLRSLNGFQKEMLIKELKQNNIEFSLGSFSNNAVVIHEKKNLNLTHMSKSPLFEIQDEGSQLISIFFEPKENEKILDYCAGAGGKTLHIADLVKDNAEIIASDKDISRTKELFKRAKKFNYQNIKVVTQKKLYKEYNHYFDKILVDAPCSGSGTFRRDPNLKYKLTPEEITNRAFVQLEILNEVKHLVKKNGEVVYATCSILEEENQNVILKFLETNTDFDLVPPEENFIKEHNIPRNQINMGINLYPINGTDGFFMCRLRKK